jgi:hypothetical protein
LDATPTPAELAERRAAQAAREALDARESAAKALRAARWCACISVLSVLLALGAVGRSYARSGNIECDSLTVGSAGGAQAIIKVDGAAVGMFLYGAGNRQAGVRLETGDKASLVQVAGVSGRVRTAALEVGNTPDLHELPRLFIVHDDRRQAVTAVWAPKWEGKD